MIFAYVVYGLSFFLLWAVLLVYNASLNKYSLMRKLWLLALFAITHGLHDWISVFMTLEKYEPAYLRVLNLGLLVLSFYFLIQFGVSSGIFGNKYRFLKAAPVAFLLLWSAATAASDQKILAGHVFARYFIGFPGAVMTSHALFIRLKEGKGLDPAFIRNIIIAAGSFLGYAFFAGFIVAPADFFPASVFNYDTFADKVGVPVHLFRAICVMALTYALSRVFHIFDMNLRDSLKRSKEVLEDAVRERTGELMISNERLKAEIHERKLIEETLLARERQQKAILGNIPDLAWLKDREGRFIAVNDAFGAACGMRPDVIAGKTDLDVWPKELAERYRADDRDVMETGRRKHFEEPIVDRFGNTIWIETIKTPIYDDRGLVIGTTGIARDITERKKAEDELQQSEKRYRQLFENMQEGFLIQDVIEDDAGNPVDVRYLDVNPAAERFLGKTRAEIIGRTRNQVLGVPDPEVVGAISRVANTGQPFHMVRYSSGAKRWYESFSYSFGTGQVATLILDITERRQTEAALQRREKQLAESQRIAHIGSWERNLTTGHMFWSDELFRIFRLDPKTDSVNFNILSEIIHTDDRAAFKKAIDETIRYNKPYSIDYRIMLKDGTTRIIHAQAELRRDETGTQAILSGTAQDITERKLAEAKVRQSEAKYRNLFELSMDGIFILDLDGNFIDANTTAYTRLGYTKEELLSLHISTLDHPEFAPRVPERLKQIREQGFAVFESAHLRKDGTTMPVEVNSRLIEYEGRTAHLSVIRDITDRKKAELELRELNRDFVIFLENTTDFVYFKDRNSRFRFCSQILANITGHASWRDMIGKNDQEVFPEDVAQIYYEEELPVFLNGIPVLNKTDPYYDAQGRMGWVSTNKWPVFDDENRVIGIFGISRDITERKKMEEEIRHMAQHDALTDLPNRRLLQEIIKIETAQAKRRRSKMALLLMDLDRFKAINDTLGHEVGDELLKEVSARFKANIRESDTVSRTGGDEFTFVVADINKAEDAADVAQKIVASLKKPFFISGHELLVTTSLGISIYPDDGEEIDTLIRYADIAMYYAKEQGRNTFQFYNPAINIRSVERIRLESMLRQTVERGELAVYYQPQIDINSQKIICSEALVRWNHPELGLLEPKRFMGMAEETGYITVIDEWVLRTVCAQVRRWLDAGLSPARTTVNLSAREFQNPHLVQKIANILKEAGTPPGYVDIEITESLAMSNITRTVYRLKELAEMGVRALIDDFGTGYSSLSQLKRLPIQKLKIDQSFIKDIATDPDDRAIINAVTSMAHSMKMKVVAEGVETEEQLVFLRKTGCDEMQGFLFSRPVTADEFEELLKAA